MFEEKMSFLPKLAKKKQILISGLLAGKGNM